MWENGVYVGKWHVCGKMVREWSERLPPKTMLATRNGPSEHQRKGSEGLLSGRPQWQGGAGENGARHSRLIGGQLYQGRAGQRQNGRTGRVIMAVVITVVVIMMVVEGVKIRIHPRMHGIVDLSPP